MLAEETARRRREKEAEEAAAAQRLREEKEKREAAKRRCDDNAGSEVMQVEAAAAAAAKSPADARPESAPREGPTGNGDEVMADGNAHAAAPAATSVRASTAPRDAGVEATVATAAAEGTTSPVRKKSRTSAQRKRRKDKKRHQEDEGASTPARGEATVNTEDAGNTPAPPGVLRQPRYSSSGGSKKAARERSASPPPRARLFADYDHKYKGVFYQASVVLSEEDKYTEYTEKVRKLFRNLKVVDETVVLEPKNPKNLAARIERESEISTDHTVLGATVVSASNATFRKVRNRDYKKKKGKKGKRGGRGTDAPLELDEEEGGEKQEKFKDPLVWFTFRLSSDEEPDELLRRTYAAWEHMGGQRLEQKAVDCFDTESAVVLYRTLIDQDAETLIAELDRMMVQARDAAEQADGGYEYCFDDPPEFSLNKFVPKIPGLDPSKYNDWDWRAQNLRKAWHIQCAKDAVPHIQSLIQQAKNHGIVEQTWGRNVALSNVLVTSKMSSSKKEARQAQRSGRRLINLCAKYASKHILYQESMEAEGLDGLLNIDEPVPFYENDESTLPRGTMTMRSVLYQYVRMADGCALFGEVHQANALAPVDVVIGRCAEAKDILEQLNDNVAAYLTFTLRHQEVSDRFITDLLKTSCNPQLILELNQCDWDVDKKRLITPRTREADGSRLEDAQWYSKVEGSLITKLNKKGGREKESENLEPEAIYDLDQEHSVTTLHTRQGKYTGTPGAPVFGPGAGRHGDAAVPSDVRNQGGSDDEMDNVSVMTGVSAGEVPDSGTTKGSAPKAAKGKPRDDEADVYSLSSSSYEDDPDDDSLGSSDDGSDNSGGSVASQARRSHDKGSSAGSTSNRSGAGRG